MAKFEKSGPGEASSKKATFLKSAEQLVEERHQDPLDVEDEREAREAEHAHRVMQAEFKARNRARTLLSMEVVRDHSPSERLTIKTPEGFPWGLRWCDEEYRAKRGMKYWVAVTHDEYEEFREYVNAPQVEKREDGKVWAGGLFLCKAPREILDRTAALHFQRSQKQLRRAVRGQLAAQNLQGKGSEIPSMQQYVEGLNRSSDEPLVKFTGTMSGDD